MTEEAKHDHPQGHELGWSAKDFGREYWVTDEDIAASTEVVHDGTQKDTH